jgi:hypothetical protein
MMMKKYTILLLASLLVSGMFAQTPVFFCKNYFDIPSMEKSEVGIWKPWSRNVNGVATSGHPDSLYCITKGLPDNGDLIVPDLELKMKTLFYDSTMYFLFRRLDDSMVSGYNADGSQDASLANGLENRDATTLYFYFSNSTYRLNNNINAASNDSVAWLRFVWSDSVNTVNTMLAQLPGSGGNTVSTFGEFHSEAIQWYKKPYYYAKISINILKLAPYLDDLMLNRIGFDIDVLENDKEGIMPFEMQTRAYLNTDLGSDPLNQISDWAWLFFTHDGNSTQYTSYIKPVIQTLAAGIFPNPANDYINIQLEESSETTLSLFDLTGRMYKNEILFDKSNVIDISGLQAGIYFIRLQNKKGQANTQKIMIR